MSVISLHTKSDVPLSVPIESLKDLKLHHDMTPNQLDLTNLQRYIIPIAVHKRDLIAVDEPNSGKTKAILLPMINHILNDKRDNHGPNSRRPIALLVAPTRPTFQKAAHIASKLSQGTGLQYALAGGDMPYDKTIERLEVNNIPVDLLISTPGRLLALLERGAVSVSDVRFFALLNVDALLDLGFEAQLRRLFDHGLPSPKNRISHISTGSLNAAVKALLSELLRPDAVHVMSDTAWRTPLRAESVSHVVKFTDSRSKQSELVITVRSCKGLCVIVTTTRRQSEVVLYTLQEAGIAAADASLEKGKLRDREAILLSFVTGSVPVLIVSDASLHSLELPNVAHVIGFDFPSSMQDLAERARLTGRQGHTGRVTTFIGEGENAEVLSDLVSMLRTGGHPVPRWLDAMIIQSVLA